MCLAKSEIVIRKEVKSVKIFVLLSMLILVFSIAGLGAYAQPLAQDTVPVNVVVDTSESAPQVFLDPNTRILRGTPPSYTVLVNRQGNYAFEGELVAWEVLVWDRNGVEDISSVGVSFGDSPGTIDKEPEAGCDIISRTDPPGNYGAKDSEGHNLVPFDPETMRWYRCVYTVEPATSIQGEKYFGVVVVDGSGNAGIFDEEEYFYFNPVITIATKGAPFTFTNPDGSSKIEPGQRVYSNTVIIKNAASDDSGVMLDIRMDGTDFFDPDPSHAKCPLSNILPLTSFAYYATSGSKTTKTNPGADSEAYDTIPYARGGISNTQKVIESLLGVPEGGDIAVTLRLDVPRPCKGNFNSGGINFYAIPV